MNSSHLTVAESTVQGHIKTTLEFRPASELRPRVSPKCCFDILMNTWNKTTSKLSGVPLYIYSFPAFFFMVVHRFCRKFWNRWWKLLWTSVSWENWQDARNQLLSHRNLYSQHTKSRYSIAVFVYEFWVLIVMIDLFLSVFLEVVFCNVILNCALTTWCLP